jgi:hypothetical protein
MPANKSWNIIANRTIQALFDFNMTKICTFSEQITLQTNPQFNRLKAGLPGRHTEDSSH